MARKLKPYAVEEVRHPRTGIKVTVYLDRDEKDFFGQVGTLLLRAKTAEECKKLVREALETFRPFEWRRVLHMEAENDTTYGKRRRDAAVHHVQMHFHFSRYELAEKFQEPGKYISRPFYEDLDEFDRETWDRDPDHFYENAWGDMVELAVPYSQELWDSLLAVRATVEYAKKRIQDLMDPADQGRKLLEMRQKGLLLAPGDVPTIPLVAPTEEENK